MHYPLHIVLLLSILSILRDDVNAAKSGLNAEVLTSFAKNVASVLSTTLLSDYQDQTSNQSSVGLLKRIQKAQSSLDLGHAESEGSEISSKASFGRYSRYTHESSPSSDGKRTFQDAYITNTPQYAKYYVPEYAPYRLAVNPNAQLSHNQVNFESSENINTGDNSIDTDVKTASLRYSDRYHHPSGFRYKPESVHLSPDPNRYSQFGIQPQYRQLQPQYRQLQPQYRHLQPQTSGGPEQSSGIEEVAGNVDGNENAETARITRRQYQLHHQGPFHAPHHPSFHGPPEFYPHGRPIEGGGQPVAPTGGQDEPNPSRLVDDQNQGQSAFAGYDYGPRFNYRPPYYGGFYQGFPGFYPRPFNDSFNPENVEQGGGNGTGGPLPVGPPFSYGPRLGPQFPYYQPYYPNFYGQGRPMEPQNPPGNQGNPEQTAAPENGQGNVNATANQPPFGFPPYGPYYGGYPFPSYQSVPFNGIPYRFGNGFHNQLFPQIKTAPYFNFYPGGYRQFPLVHLYPFGGYYPYNNQQPMMMPEKPAQPEKTMNENAEPVAPPANSGAETLSESKPEMIQSSASN